MSADCKISVAAQSARQINPFGTAEVNYREVTEVAPLSGLGSVAIAGATETLTFANTEQTERLRDLLTSYSLSRRYNNCHSFAFFVALGEQFRPEEANAHANALAQKTDIPRSPLQPGQLVFILGPLPGSRHQVIHHTAIYVGEGTFLSRLGQHGLIAVTDQQNTLAYAPGSSLTVAIHKSTPVFSRYQR